MCKSSSIASSDLHRLWGGGGRTQALIEHARLLTEAPSHAPDETKAAWHENTNLGGGEEGAAEKTTLGNCTYDTSSEEAQAVQMITYDCRAASGTEKRTPAPI